MDIAEHFARYSMLRSICVGKRVLDVACGEGYGCYLMAHWGAASITGVDLSPDAIRIARAKFSAQNVTYHEGDVCRLAELLPPDSRFDLICSFETIEHLVDPQAFLSSLAKVRTDESVIAISAPNDHILPEGVSNPYHLQRYDLDSLKATTEAALGPARVWMFGIPFQGFLLASEFGSIGDSLRPETGAGFCFEKYGALDLIPPAARNLPSSNNVHFWVGVWGEGPLPAAVGAPQSMTSWQEPWRALEYYKEHEGYLEAELKERRAHEGYLEAELKERRAHEGYLEAELKESRAQIRSFEAKLAEERRAGLAIREQLGESRSRVDELRLRVDELGSRGTKLSEETIKTVASEVWRERRRRRLTSKVRRWFKKRQL
jgi:SAM-dependent methyltransferase